MGAPLARPEGLLCASVVAGARSRRCVWRCYFEAAVGAADSNQPRLRCGRGATFVRLRDQWRCGWHSVGQQRHLGCDGGAPLLGFSVSLWSLTLKPLHRGDGGMQGLEPPSLPIPNVSSTSGESVASSVSAASEHREGAALIYYSPIHLPSTCLLLPTPNISKRREK